MDDDRPIGVRLRERHSEKRKALEMERKSRPASPSQQVAEDPDTSGEESWEADPSDPEPAIETKAPRKAQPRLRARRPNATHTGLDKAVGDWLQSASRHPGLQATGALPTLAATIRAWLMSPTDRWVDKIRLRAGLSELMPRLRDSSNAEREQIISGVVGALDTDVESRNGSQASIARMLVRSGHHLGDALLPTTRQLLRELGPCAVRLKDQLNDRSRHYDSSFVNELLTSGTQPHDATLWLAILQELAGETNARRDALIARLQDEALHAVKKALPIRVSQNFFHGLASFHGGADMSNEQLAAIARGLLAPFVVPVTDEALRSAFGGLCEALALDGWNPAHRDLLADLWLAPQDDAALARRTALMLPGLIQPTHSRLALRELLDRALEGAEMGPTPRQNALLLHIIRSLRDDPAIGPQEFACLAPELGAQLGLHMAGTPGQAGQALASGAHELLSQFPGAAAHSFMSGLVQSLAATGMLADDEGLAAVSRLVDPPGATPRNDLWTPLDEQGNLMPAAALTTHKAHPALEGLFEGLLRHGQGLTPARLQAWARGLSHRLHGMDQAGPATRWRHPVFHPLTRHPGSFTPGQVSALAQGVAEALSAEAQSRGPGAWATLCACVAAGYLRGTRQQALVQGLVQGFGGPAAALQRAPWLPGSLRGGLAALPDEAARSRVAELFMSALGGAQMPRDVAWALMREATAGQAATHPEEVRGAAQALEAALRQVLGESAFQSARTQAGIRWDRPDRFAGVPPDLLQVGVVSRRHPLDSKADAAAPPHRAGPGGLSRKELQAANAWLAMLAQRDVITAQHRELAAQKARLKSSADQLSKLLHGAFSASRDDKAAQPHDKADLDRQSRALSKAQAQWADAVRAFDQLLAKFSRDIGEPLQAGPLHDPALASDPLLRREAFEAFQSRYEPELDAAGWLRDAVAMGLRLGVNRSERVRDEALHLRLERLRRYAAESETPLGHDPVLAGLLLSAGRPFAKGALSPKHLEAACKSALVALMQWVRAPGEREDVDNRTLACVLQTLRIVASGLAPRNLALAAIKDLPGTQAVAPGILAGWVGTLVDTLGLTNAGGSWLDLVAALPGWSTRHGPDALRAAATALSTRLQADAGHFPERLAAALARLAREPSTASPVNGQGATAVQAIITGLCPADQRAQAFLQAVDGLGLPELHALMRPAIAGTPDAQGVALFERQIPALLAVHPSPGADLEGGEPLRHAPVRLADLAWFLGRRRLPDTNLRTLAGQHLPAGDSRRTEQHPWLRAALIATRLTEVMHEHDMPLPARRALLQALCAIQEREGAGEPISEWLAIANGGLPDTSKSGALVTLTPMVRSHLRPNDFRTMRLQVMDAIEALQARLAQADPALPEEERANLDLRITECSNDLAGLYMQWRHLPSLAFAYQPPQRSAPSATPTGGSVPDPTQLMAAREALAFLDAELAAARRAHVHPLTAALLTTAINSLRQPLLALLPPVPTGGGLMAD